MAKSPAFGERCLLIQRTRTLRGRAYALVASFVVESIGRRLTRQSVGKRPALVAIEDCGIRLATCTQTGRAIAADSIVAEQLGLPLGAPLFNIRRIALAADGSPVEFADIAFAHNLYELQATLRIERSGDSLSWVPLAC